MSQPANTSLLSITTRAIRTYTCICGHVIDTQTGYLSGSALIVLWLCKSEPLNFHNIKFHYRALIGNTHTHTHTQFHVKVYLAQ